MIQTEQSTSTHIAFASSKEKNDITKLVNSNYFFRNSEITERFIPSEVIKKCKTGIISFVKQEPFYFFSVTLSIPPEQIGNLLGAYFIDWDKIFVRELEYKDVGKSITLLESLSRGYMASYSIEKSTPKNWNGNHKNPG